MASIFCQKCEKLTDVSVVSFLLDNGFVFYLTENWFVSNQQLKPY